MALTQSFDRTVSRMMARYGGDAFILLQDDSSATYDPATSALTGIVKTSVPVRAIFLDYTLQRNGLTDVQNSVIQAGDKQCFIQPINKADSNLVMPIISPNKDRIQVADKVYKILSLKKIDTGMDNPVLFELHLKE